MNNSTNALLELNDPLEHISNQHPCFGKGPNLNKGRIHLPVSPSCNIQCAFCNRTKNKEERRPGVTSEILTPVEATEILDKALELCPEITVAGIAGPGDTLASDYAIETFKLIKEKHPELINCLSTNGLLLEKRAEELIEAGVKTVTVTVNAVDPEVLKHICLWIVKDGITYTGVEGARILLDAQLRGIKKIKELGAMVKVNTVLCPGINDDHIEEVAKTVSELGADYMNIIPLIPTHKLAHLKEPDCMMLHETRTKAEKYIRVFKHCQRCRADAAGIPGKVEIADQLYDLKKLNARNTFSHG